MAAFGAPIARTSDQEIRQDAVNAVNCALATQTRVIALNRRLEQREWPLISMRIGILSGRVVGGSIGQGQDTDDSHPPRARGGLKLLISRAVCRSLPAPVLPVAPRAGR
jgi:hypothetical protein